MKESYELYRRKIIGLGDQSSRKSYYPELQDKIDMLEAHQRNMEATVNNIQDGMVIHDAKGRLLSFNQQAKKIFNIKEEEKDQYTILDITSPKTSVSELYTIWEEVMTGKARVIEWTILQLHTREEILVQISINPTIWNGKHVLVGVFRDFSERKKYEEELVAAWKKAEENDRLKSTFLANLSHEIRTPMNAILGFTNLLSKPDLAADIRDNYISIVNKSGQHLLSIIDDIIEISKIETGQLTPNYSRVNVSSCIRDIYSALSVTIPADKDIKLRLSESNPKEDVWIITDRIKLNQILTNLITNAIKYTEKGFVNIAFGWINNNQDMEFRITDTGAGIEKKHHSMIFDRFSRIENDLTIKIRGSGLGLAISKAYVEMLGGVMKVESEPGKGSVFSFTIPGIDRKGSETDRKSEKKQEKTVITREGLILIAEDDDVNYLYLSAVLSSSDYSFVRAGNGQEAIDLASSEPCIKLILMDLKMPVLSGYEAFKVIRKTRPDLPVIAQSAYIISEDEKRHIYKGFDAYITKPIQEEILLSLIRQYWKS